MAYGLFPNPAVREYAASHAPSVRGRAREQSCALAPQGPNAVSTVRPLRVKLDGNRSARDGVVAELLGQIRSGCLAPGSVLPPEREFAAQCGVSRGTLREAIRILDYAGILEVRTRSGTYVSDTALAKGIELRAHAALRGEESPLDTMVARRALEPVNARYAALNRHVRDLSALKKSVRDQRRLIDRGETPTRWTEISTSQWRAPPTIRS